MVDNQDILYYIIYISSVVQQSLQQYSRRHTTVTQTQTYTTVYKKDNKVVDNQDVIRYIININKQRYSVAQTERDLK